jgi:hypothetical protein
MKSPDLKIRLLFHFSCCSFLVSFRDSEAKFFEIMTAQGENGC